MSKQNEDRGRRKRAIAVLAERLKGDENPRLAMFAVLVGAGTSGFLTAVGLLKLGLGSMALRYSLAACVGYLAFLLGIKVWLTLRLRHAGPRSGWRDLLDPSAFSPGSGMPTEPGVAFGGGGGFSGGGAGGVVDATSLAPPVEAPDATSVGLGDVGDLDESIAIVVVPIVLVGIVIVGLFGSVAILIGAPSLLAEVLLDGLIAAWAYRHLRHLSRRHWLTGVVRRSWKPFLAILVTLALGGFVLQSAFPAVRSIGDVWR